MQNSQCHSLHPEKISLSSNSNADIFRGSEAVFFLSTAQPTLLCHAPHHPFQRCSKKNKALDFSNAHVLHKVFSHFTSLHFGKLKQNYLHLLRSIPAHLIASPHSKRISFLIPLFFPTASDNGMLYFLLRSVCPIANARKEVIGHFPKEKRIKRKAKLGGSAQCQRSIKNPKDYGIMARQIRCFAI